MGEQGDRDVGAPGPDVHEAELSGAIRQRIDSLDRQGDAAREPVDPAQDLQVARILPADCQPPTDRQQRSDDQQRAEPEAYTAAGEAERGMPQSAAG